jgi:hypothetical protein
MQKKFVTTPKHFQVFKSYCQKWIDFLGLRGWFASFYHQPDNCQASVTSYPYKRSAKFNLSRKWKIRVTDAELERCAIHECLHLVLSLFADTARRINEFPESMRGDALNREEEAIVVILENIFASQEKQNAVHKTIPTEIVKFQN